jgi:hypothetical protein
VKFHRGECPSYLGRQKNFCSISTTRHSPPVCNNCAQPHFQSPAAYGLAWTTTRYAHHSAAGTSTIHKSCRNPAPNPIRDLTHLSPVCTAPITTAVIYPFISLQKKALGNDCYTSALGGGSHRFTGVCKQFSRWPPTLYRWSSGGRMNRRPNAGDEGK